MQASASKFFGTNSEGVKLFLESIQGLRGFSAVSVMLAHVYLMAEHKALLPGMGGGTGLPGAFASVWSVLGNGVALFFIISGFLIPASLLRHRDIGRFMVDRALRILPVYLVLTAVVFAVGPLIGYKWMADLSRLHFAGALAANALFIAPLIGVPLAQQNSWSLTYEWIFYLTMAAAYVLHYRAHSRIGLGLVLALGAVGIVVWPVCLFFVLGMAFAYYGWVIRLPTLIGLVAGVAALAALYGLHEDGSDWLAWIPGAIVFGIVLDQRSGLARMLNTRVMSFLGRISYSLYLVHPFVVFGSLVIASRLDAHGMARPLVFAIYVIIALTVSVIAAAISYELLEVRLRRLLGGMIARPRLLPVPVAAG